MTHAPAEQVYPIAHVTAPWGNVTDVATMSVPAFAWDDPEARREYKKAYRRYALEDCNVSDSRGWRVTWSATRAAIE